MIAETITARCERSQGPQAEALVGVAWVFDGVGLAEQPQRRAERERGALEVQGAPAAERGVGVGMIAGERGRQQVAGSAAPEVAQRGRDLAILEVDEAVAAEDQIDTGQGIADDVERDEAALGSAVTT